MVTQTMYNFLEDLSYCNKYANMPNQDVAKVLMENRNLGEYELDFAHFNILVNNEKSIKDILLLQDIEELLKAFHANFFTIIRLDTFKDRISRVEFRLEDSQKELFSKNKKILMAYDTYKSFDSVLYAEEEMKIFASGSLF